MRRSLAKQALLAGEPLPAVAARLGLNKNTLRRYATQENLPVNPVTNTSRIRRTLSAGFTPEELAPLFRTTPGRIREILHHHPH